MGVTMKLNVAKTLETTASKSIFMDVPKDGKVRVRYLPAVKGSEGSLFALVRNHFRLKNEEGDRGIAVACNVQHGDGKCLLCEVADYLKNSEDKTEAALGDGRESIKASNGWYAQVLPAIKKADGAFEYGSLKLLRLPKTGATKVGNIMKVQNEEGEPIFVDEDQGRDLVVSRADTGVQFTQYDAMTVGLPSALKDIRPQWESDILSWDDLWKKLDLKKMTYEEQRICLVRSYPNMDWDAIFTSMEG